MEPTKKPIEQSFVDRVSSAWATLMGRNTQNAYMGPGQPLVPQVSAQEQDSVVGRQFDYPFAVNTTTNNRDTGGATFDQLRALADNCNILRLVIETRKDQMAKLSFTVNPIDPKKKPDARCQEVQAFFKLPDGENNWDTWLRMLLEDMFVIDAATVYPWLNNDGTPYRFELMDGATIKRLIDGRGRTPAPPQPAYQQKIKGYPTSDYTVEELIYSPRNRRTNRIYGYSPVEQIIMTVNTAIRRALWQLQFYTEGSMPDLIFQVPVTWNNKQVADFNMWWQDRMAGNTAERRKAQFVPNGVDPVNIKEGALTDKYDEWLARIVCYAFSVSHTAFVAQVNRATADSAQQQALEEGLYPVMQWVKGVCDSLIWRYFGYTDLEFKWSIQQEVSPDVQSKIDDLALKNGSKLLNEVRDSHGMDPVEGGDTPMVLTATGYVPLDAYAQQQQDKKDAAASMAASLAAGGAEGGNAPTTGKAVPEKTPPEPSDKAEKIAKAKIKPIAHDRPFIAKQEIQLADSLYTMFQRMAVKVVEQVSGLQKAKKKPDPDDIEFDEWIEQMEGDLEKSMVATATSGVGEAYQQLTLDSKETFTTANEAAVDWAKQHAASMVGKKYNDDGDLVAADTEMDILESTRTMMRGDIADAVEEGWTTDELANKLADSYTFSKERAQSIARTEVARADVKGSLILYKESGVVESKQWITGAGCCDLCQELNKTTVPVDEDFPDDGGDGPPLHPNCRCDVIPIVDQGDDNES